MKNIILPALVMLVSFSIQAQVILYESFDFLEGVIGDESYDWKLLNVSDPLGTPSAESWYQADMTMGINAYQGMEPNCYVQADRFATSATTGGAISNWLISPVVFINEGDSVRFYAVSYDNTNRPDKIEVRISTQGVDSTLPTTATENGSFNSLIGVINADLTTTGFPSIQNNQSWTRYSFPVVGIGFDNACRVALRYHVSNAGLQGPNGSAIAIDEFYITGPDGFIGVNEFATKQSLSSWPNPASDAIRISASNANENLSYEIIDLNGKVVLAQQNFNSNSEIDISTLPQGVYLLKATNQIGETMHTRFIKQ